MANQKEEKGNGFKRLLLFLVLPGAILVVIGGIFLSVLGLSPMEQLRTTVAQWPLVSTWISEDEDDGAEHESFLTEKDEEIVHLEQQLQQAQDTIDELDEEIEQMEEDETFEASAEELDEAEAPEELTRIARVYENMRPGQAAEIMEELTNDEVLQHMAEMNDDSRSTILANMDPERAAEITSLLTD
ncbi:MotE family protein [Salicibibacter kimchii]|uniref:Magnesium transporter MgtE intracellular domain-containing protein n=1 Tax=Salicibibacter kimchii TaxID=2099786 RepID=A0A345BVZ9_9BACI|nr:hypothetical protein [Salicibibacter kimchii]AXF55130.1 hypothetical protein DT065_03245 [Salicibibacter kimchii]